MGTKNKALIYTRVSTREQAEEGRYSLETQENTCREYAAANGYKVVALHSDPGKSATNRDRPGLNELLDQCTSDTGITAVLVQDMDRLARNTLDHLSIKKILQKSGVKLVSVSQPMFDDSEESQMIETVLAGFNQYQSELSGRKVRKSIQTKLNNGWWPRSAPIGYLNTESNGEKIITADQDRLPLIAEAFKLYSSGLYSLNDVIETLNKKGLRTKKGKKIRRSILANALKNPFYIGTMVWNGIEYPGNHEVLVDKATFKAVQRIFASRKQNTRQRKHDFLLRGFCFCSCSAQITAEHHFEKRKSYYRCTRMKGQCHEPYIPTNDLESQVEDLFKTIQFDSSFKDLVLTKLNELINESTSDYKRDKKRLNRQLGILNEKLITAEEKLLQGTLTDAAYIKIRNRIESEIDELQDAIDEIIDDKSITPEQIEEIFSALEKLHHTFTSAQTKQKKQLLKIFWDRFEVTGKSVVSAIPTEEFSELLRLKNAVYKEPGLNQVRIADCLQG